MERPYLPAEKDQKTYICVLLEAINPQYSRLQKSNAISLLINGMRKRDERRVKMIVLFYAALF